MAFSDYTASLEYLRSIYTALNADLAARQAGTFTTHTPAELAAAMTGITTVGQRLQRMFEAMTPMAGLPLPGENGPVLEEKKVPAITKKELQAATNHLLALMKRPDLVSFISQQNLASHGANLKWTLVPDLKKLIKANITHAHLPAIQARYLQLSGATPPPLTATHDDPTTPGAAAVRLLSVINMTDLAKFLKLNGVPVESHLNVDSIHTILRQHETPALVPAMNTEYHRITDNRARPVRALTVTDWEYLSGIHEGSTMAPNGHTYNVDGDIHRGGLRIFLHLRGDDGSGLPYGSQHVDYQGNQMWVSFKYKDKKVRAFDTPTRLTFV